MKKYNCQCFHGNQRTKRLFAWRGLLILFYFYENLSRITLWDVTFCFHKHSQGVRQSPISYSLKTEPAAMFAGLFKMSLSTNFMYKWVTVPRKYWEKEETVSKCNIKYYYIESHSGQKAFPPAFQLFKHQGSRVSVWYAKAHLYQLEVSGSHLFNCPFISPP